GDGRDLRIREHAVLAAKFRREGRAGGQVLEETITDPDNHEGPDIEARRAGLVEAGLLDAGQEDGAAEVEVLPVGQEGAEPAVDILGNDQLLPVAQTERTQLGEEDALDVAGGRVVWGHRV